jgi:N-acetylglucosaminyldiphosphoundecaprenol N-acetyl-beta-D-mannosaminyltransferase
MESKASLAEAPSVRLMGASFGALRESDVIDVIVGAAAIGRGHWTITANLDHLRRYTAEDMAKELIEEADLVVADGTPLVWASRLAGTSLPERVAGSNLIWSICGAASRQGTSVFLLGGDPGVGDRAAEALTRRFPDLQIAGTSCPPFGFEEDEEALERIASKVRDAEADIVMVALGFPKQDIVIRRIRRVRPSASYIGVGISFSFVAGDVPRAPGWTHTLGLEWAHRLMQEPRRLARRYLVEGIPFLFRLFTSAIWFRLRIGRAKADWGWDHR